MITLRIGRKGQPASNMEFHFKFWYQALHVANVLKNTYPEDDLITCVVKEG